MSDQNSLGLYEGIAIVGMSGRFPGAKNVDQFWDNILEGRETVTKFSSDELEIDIPEEDLAEGGAYVCAKGMLDDIDMFDARFFGYLPKEAEVMDPQHRMFLEICSEAIEHAGYDASRYEGAIGVYGGCYMDTYVLSNLCSDEAFRKKLVESIQVGTLQTELGNDKDYLATRVAFKLGLRGPAMTLQTACSTSLVSIATACQSLDSYQCDMALAGGVTIVLPQKKGYFYKEGSMLSPDGSCRPFDEDAAGTVFSNGAAVVLLKRLEDAVKDNDTIYGVIKGYATNNDGGTKVSYTAPSVDGQAEVISLAMAMGEVEPHTMGYVEAHGTATPLGDPIEVAGLTKAYRQNTDEKQYCALGSVKGNLGHLDCASGAIGTIKATLSLHTKTLTPLLHFKAPNPKIDFENSPFYVNTEKKKWPERAWPRRAGVSSFGVGGTNAHVVIEEAPLLPKTDCQQEYYLLPLSAKSENALAMQAAQLADDLEQDPEKKLGDIAYTLQEGRQEYTYRGFVTGATREELIKALREERGLKHKAKLAVSKPELGYLFPGQGAQYPSMGAGLYHTEPVYRETIDTIAEVLLALPDFKVDIREFILWSEEISSVSKEEASNALAETWLTQPAIFACEMAMARLLEHWGYVPEIAIGHSVGEFAAICHAGMISLEDACVLVAERGRLIHALEGGKMLAIMGSKEDIQPYLSDAISIAALNGPTATVVSGPETAIDTLKAILDGQEIKSTKLATSHAFHSAMMQEAEDPFAEVIKRTEINPISRFKIYSTALGREVSAQELCEPSYWTAQMREAVQFMPAVQKAAEDHEQMIFVEIGPGQALSSFVKQTLKGDAQRAVYPAMGNVRVLGSDYQNTLTVCGQLWLNGLRPEWEGMRNGSVRRVALPTYPFERKSYWIEANEKSNPAQSPVIVGGTEVQATASAVPVQNAPTNVENMDELETLIQQQLNVISGQLKMMSGQ